MSTYKDNIFVRESYSYANYQYRWISKKIFNHYYNHICSMISPDCIKNVLDICCGTGQFAVNLSHLIPTSQIYALDSSYTQLNKLKEIMHNNNINNIIPIESSFEDYYASRNFDLLTCSEAIHLFDDLSSFALKVSKILNSNGILCIRTPSPAQFMERNIYEYFPTCRYINLVRCKGPELIESAFSLYNLHIIDKMIVDESKIYNKEQLMDAFRSKMFSTLSIIPQKEYYQGLHRLERELDKSGIFYYDFHMTSYIIGRH